MMRVLVAEPSRTLGAFIRSTLGELGCELEIVADGSSAMAAARQRWPDALIADVALPGLDGYALAHALRQLGGARRLPTLLLAPDHAVIDHERLAYVGVSEVLTKPFERAVLLARFQALVGARPDARKDADTARTTAGDEAWVPTRPEAPSVDLKQLELDMDARVRERVADELQRRLPALVQAAVEQALPRIVRDELDALVRDRLGPTFERTVRSAVQDLAEPARVDALVRETLEKHLAGSVVDATRTVSERIETQATRDLQAFVRGELPKRLERQAEQIVWKVVPALAENLVKEEIKRLTEP
jgi:DNA-binding response OmpR family regulator